MTEAKGHSAPQNGGQPGHETRDVSVGNLAAFGLILLALIIFGLLVSGVVEHYFFQHQSLGPPPTPFESRRELPPPNKAPLQTDPAEDFGHFAGREQQILTSYGWVDAKAGIARIPIDRAMAILLQNGFPTESSLGEPEKAKSGHEKAGKGKP